MALDYTGNDTANTDKNPEGLAQSFTARQPFIPGRVIRQVNPSRSPYEAQEWVNTQTGERFIGSAGNSDPSQIVMEGGTGGEHKTTQYDANTGKKVIQNNHPWWDAAKNVAMIWGGPETAGALSAFGGGGAAAAGAGGAGGSSAASAAPVAAGAAGGAAGTGGAVGATGSILSAFGKWAPIVDVGAKVASGIEQGRLAGKAADAAQAQAQNNQAIEIARQQALADAAKVNQQMAQKTLQAGDYQRNLRNAIMSGLMDPNSGVQDINFNLPDRIASHMGSVTGGLRPSALGNRGDISSTVGPQALEALTHNPTTNDLLPPAGSVSPNLTPYPTGSGLDTALGGTAIGLSALSALSSLWPRPSSPVMGTNVTPNPGMNGATFLPPQAGQNGSIYTVPRAFQGINFYGGG